MLLGYYKRNIGKFFLFFLITMLALFPIACSDDDDSTAAVFYGFTAGGYVYDITTGSVVTTYTITIETATATYTGSVNTTTGKYTIQAPYNADYIVKIEATNYKTFTSTNPMLSTTHYNGTNYHDNYMIAFRNIPLIPTTVLTPAIAVNVYDNDTGAPIAAGYYKVVRGAVAVDVEDLGGMDDLATGVPAWTQDEDVIAGSFTTGAISIAEGALL